ncbi:MAG: type II toxin-antitoxin system RelE/ParE family toxin [Alphaproteobacteria bacterium]|nr:type II toxin-antitoxin system RelE/ParE family toxin [Alphaproteobacteria bacterium]
MRRAQWRARALADLDRTHAWLSTLEYADADRTILRIRAAANSLCRLGDIGRPSRVTGLREMSVRGAPYVVVYRVRPGVIDILAVYHHAQDR